MQLLNTPAALCEALQNGFEKATSIHAATAWASVNFEGFELLKAHRRKLRRFLVGVHFHQTHPAFIEEFFSEKSVRFIMSPDGTFHPKVYFFELPDGGWRSIVGSPNFTRAAFESNAELAVLVECTDQGGAAFKKGFFDALDGWWHQGKHLNQQELKVYREQWKRSQQALPRKKAIFGRPTATGVKSDGGADVSEIPVCQMEWDDFFRRVKKERNSANKAAMPHRLEVIAEIRASFKETPRFADMEKDRRNEVAGLVRYEDIDFLWFGSMRGAGKFKGAISRNEPHISTALDQIPFDGPVGRGDYLAFVAEFEKAFPKGGGGVATATRLLAMKRPDLFVCLDNANRRRLCAAFKIRQAVGYEDYWDSIVERIRASTWWNVSRPKDRTQAAVWDARAAMLDALFYEWE